MNCNANLLPSEIDVPKHNSELKDSITLIYPLKIDGDTEEEKMGLENTWTDDEFVVPRTPDHPVALTQLTNTVDVTTFEDSTPSTSTPLLDEFDCLISSGASTAEPQDDPLFDGDMPEASCEAGVCGLRNLGNTCFMNAGIQCLVATSPLSAELLHMHAPRPSLTSALSDLMRRMWSGQASCINPDHFRRALAALYPQFNDYRQHDCQEFLALLLNGLHEQMNTASSKDSSSQVDPTQLCSSKNLKAQGIYEGDQSTSKKEERRCEDETLLIRELVQEVSEMQKKQENLDKTTQVTNFESSSSQESTEEVVASGGASFISPTKNRLNNHQPTFSTGPKEEIPVFNNQVQRINGFDDILKDAKTSNLNVLVKKEEANNEIRFDSEKYPRTHNPKSKTQRFSINALQFDNNTHGKRNSSLSSVPFSLDFSDGLDLKRVKLHSTSDEVEDKNRRLELERQQNSPDDLLLEKNERMECERKESKGSFLRSTLHQSLFSPNHTHKTPEVEADKHWQKHLAENKSIVVNTFQGQFKSTVVCSICGYISVTYEPFMYLSVPLPNAMQKKLKVTFIGESLMHPTEFLLELNKYDTVNYLRDQILLKVGCEVKGTILIAEVLNHHLAKFLEENQLIRYLNDSERSLYAFEVKTLLDKSTVEPIEDKVEEYLGASSCIICFEDKDVNMKHHEECSCILCEACIADSCAHYGRTTINCPVCRKEINPDIHLKPLKPQPCPTTRMMNIPVVFRLDEGPTKSDVKLFGHPMVIRVPSRCSSEALHGELAASLVYKQPFKLLLVDGQGLRCSRCMFHIHCRGCELTAEVTFSNSDSLAVTFTTLPPLLPTTSSLALLSARPSALTLYDCIQAFSQSETLDGNNPWFCPQCKQNRSALKTLSVWRYPDYLIVYLKRFVFHNQISTKLEDKVLFPLTGLSLASGSDYDLYACVCHIGGVSAGHYTTYTQHPYSGQWHYFNDSSVSKQSPVDEDTSYAYILFYKKQGLQPPSMDFSTESGSRES